MLPSKLQTPEGWIEVAKNSYPFIAELAMYHLYVAEGVSTNIKGNTQFFQKENLQLKKYGNSYRLDMLPEMREVTEEKMMKIIEDKKKESKFVGDATVGCLAMINFGEGSAVDRIWSWNIDLAPVIYQSSGFLHTYNYVVNSS